MQDLSKMSNQERIMAFGVEEASKYHGPYKRRHDEPKLLPALSPTGGNWYLQQLALEKLAKKMGEKFKSEKTPANFVYNTESFRNKPKPKPHVTTFKKKDIRGRRRKCATG